jgi:hypothetical protein
MSWLEDSSIEFNPWQVEDLREVPLEKIFLRLESLGVKLDQQSFFSYAKASDDPEALADFVSVEEDNFEKRDQIYLLIFELWRRLLPEKLTLSIFCDELDRSIYLYDQGLLDKESMERGISILEDLLDEGVDEGENPKALFETFKSYCAQDLERFLYDYIAEELKLGNETEASELLDEFYLYIEDERWFDFLRAQLLISNDAQEGNLMLQRVLEQLEEDPEIELLFEVAKYLVNRGDPSLFSLCVKIVFPLLKKEEEIQKLLKIIAEYFSCLDLEKPFEHMKRLLESRKARDPKESLDTADKVDLSQFLNSLLNNA